MNHEIKFYCGKDKKDLRFLGALELADLRTYQYYLEIFQKSIPISIWFNFYENAYIHRNVRLNHSGEYTYYEIDNSALQTKFIAIVVSDINKVTFLTDAEFKNQGRIDELIKQISQQPPVTI